MLRSWLGPARYEEFLAARAEGRAFAEPTIATFEPDWPAWSVLARVLASPDRDVLVTADGALVEACAPANVEALRQGMRRGLGLVARRAERCERGLRELAARFRDEFARPAHVQLFVTPQETRGFRWHYDVEDVVILQTRGSTSYYLRANTQLAPQRLDPPDFRVFARESSPVAVCTLGQGGALYLPRGMWHMGRAHEDSFSVSTGLEWGLHTS